MKISKPGFIIIGLILSLSLLFMVAGCVQQKDNQTAVSNQVVYRCPMHPTYTLDKPGDCPICGMKLVKSESNSLPKTMGTAAITKKERRLLYYRNPMNPQVTSPVPMKDQMGMDYIPVYEEANGAVDGEVTINQAEEKLVGVEIDKVGRRPLYKEIRTVGIVANDPDLYIAEQEYLSALSLADESLIESGKNRLQILGLNDEQIEKLEKEGKAQQNLILPSDKTWVYITIYENEMGLVKVATPVELDTVAYPGEVFSGKIAAVSAVLDPLTRSLKARTEIENYNQKLKPGMYANVVIKVNLGNRLAVVEEAVINTGRRAIVVVSKGGGKFVSQDVKLGQKAQGYYEVLAGLAEGDMVVTTGNFLLDSESRLRSGAGKEHQH